MELNGRYNAAGLCLAACRPPQSRRRPGAQQTRHGRVYPSVEMGAQSECRLLCAQSELCRPRFNSTNASCRQEDTVLLSHKSFEPLLFTSSYTPRNPYSVVHHTGLSNRALSFRMTSRAVCKGRSGFPSAPLRCHLWPRPVSARPAWCRALRLHPHSTRRRSCGSSVSPDG